MTARQDVPVEIVGVQHEDKEAQKTVHSQVSQYALHCLGRGDPQGSRNRECELNKWFKELAR